MTLPEVFAIASLSAIVSIWLGYPLLIWAAARIAPAKSLAGTGTQDRMVSVILATRDSPEILRARIANLLDTEHPAEKLEIIVALDANGAQCAPSDLQGIDNRIIAVIGDSPGGKAAALNAGVRAASGEILVMADAHQRYDARTIPELVSGLHDETVGAVSGALQLGTDGRVSPVDIYWTMEKWLRKNEALIHSSVGVTGAVYATRRSLWPVVPPGTLLDDVFVPMSLVLNGYRIGFTYAARAFDIRTFDSTKESARKTRTLTGILQLRELLPDLMSIRRNPIFLQFVAHKLLRMLTPVFAVTFAVCLAWIGAVWLLHASVAERWIVAGIVGALFGVPKTRRRIVTLFRWVISLQSATARAVLNGFAGRWEVWTKSST